MGGVSSRGPGGLGGTAEVGAIVPDGAVGADTIIRDGAGGPVRGEEVLEMRDVLELQKRERERVSRLGWQGQNSANTTQSWNMLDRAVRRVYSIQKQDTSAALAGGRLFSSIKAEDSKTIFVRASMFTVLQSLAASQWASLGAG